jgi:hypothetical protein
MSTQNDKTNGSMTPHRAADENAGHAPSTPPAPAARYADPLGDFARSARAGHEAQLASFPALEESYDGFYFEFLPESGDGERYFASGEGTIGSELYLAVGEDVNGNDSTVQLVTRDDRQLAALTGDTAQRLVRHLSAGWRCRLGLEIVFYSAQDKQLSCSVACICYAPEVAHAMDVFATNIFHRLQQGDRPTLQLQDDDYLQVMRSGGKWFLTKTLPKRESKKGRVTFKGRRTLTDQLVNYATEHRSGCNLLAIAFWIIGIAAIVFGVWWIFFK